jgi:hypothetical protein
MKQELANIINLLSQTLTETNAEINLKEAVLKTKTYLEKEFFDTNGKLKNDNLVFFCFEKNGHDLKEKNQQEIVASAILVASWAELCKEKKINFQVALEFNKEDIKLFETFLTQKPNLTSIQGNLAKWILDNNYAKIIGHDEGREATLEKTDNGIARKSNADETVRKAQNNIEERNTASINFINNSFEQNKQNVVLSFYGDLHFKGIKSKAPENYFLISNDGNKPSSPAEFLKKIGITIDGNLSYDKNLEILSQSNQPEVKPTNNALNNGRN